MYSDMGVKAVKTYTLIVTIVTILLLQQCITPSIRVTQEQNRGDLHFNQHNYTEAAQHYNLMLEESRKLGIYRNPSMEAEVLRKLANCNEMTGNYEEALIHVEKSLELDSVNNNLIGKIAGNRQKGKILIYMGRSRTGTSSLEKALALSEGMDNSLKSINRVAIADNYLITGQLYSVMGQSENALKNIKRALELYKNATDRRGEMEADLTLAGLLADQGEISDAGKLIQESLRLAEQVNAGTSRHYQLLASLATESGEYENALRYQERAVAEARKFGIMGQIIWAEIGLGDIYSRLGDYAKAEDYYRNAQRVKDTLHMTTGSIDASIDLRLGDFMNANEYYSSEGSFTGEAISALRIGEMLSRRGRTDSAMVYFNLSENRFRASGNREGTANVLLQKGRLFVDMNKPSAAIPLLDSASKVTDFPETSWQAWFHLGRAWEKQFSDEKAADCYRNSIAVIEKIRGNLTIDEFKSSYFENKREVYDRLIRILLRMNKPVDAFQVSEQARARAFYDILSNKKIDYKGSVPGDLISLEQEKRIEIQKLYKLIQKNDLNTTPGERSATSGMKELRESLLETQAEYEDILTRIKMSNPAYAEMVTAQPVSLSSLKESLDSSTAVLAYWLSDNQLIAWLITKNVILPHITDIEESEVTLMIENSRRAIRSNSQEESTLNLKLLNKILFQPFEKDLANFTNLVIIPNGALHFLPFQALVSENGKYLVEKYNLVYAPSASVFMICNSRKAVPGSKFMGVALSGLELENRQPLPGTEEEVRKIEPLFLEHLTAIGKESTETFVKKNSPGYNFIHFATHGNYNYEQPLYSHLLFPAGEDDDGRLNVYEVFEMSLNASLVTLSACETGLGNISQGDELVGLSRAFLFAGSSSVIVSLWSVADYPTSLLMTNFYNYLKKYPVQEALTLAQRDVLKIYPQPQYWSPFVLIGNGNISIE